MDYKELLEELKNLEAVAYGYHINYKVLGMDCSDFEQIIVDATDSITDLLARAEAAEKRLEVSRAELNAARKAQLENQTRAEKAEKERDEAAEAICTHCEDFPCPESDCPWWRGQKEE